MSWPPQNSATSASPSGKADLGNLDKDSNLSVQANARMIEPGYSLTPEKAVSMPKCRR